MRTSSGTRSVGHVRVVSANKLANNEESYPAVAKYTGTYAYQGAIATSGDTKKILLDATANTPTAPNLEVIGTHGDFWLVKVRKATLSWPLLLERTEIRLVEKIYSKAKPNATDAEKQNISRVYWPIDEEVSSRFGFRVLSGNEGNQAKSHQGVDTYASNTSRPVYAIMDGTVVNIRRSSSSTGRGTLIVIEHKIAGGYTYYTTYQHLNNDNPNKILVSMHEKVTAGKPIATAGDTGAGPLHHHFQIHRGHPGADLDDPNENVINPIDIYPSADIRTTKGYNNPNAFFKKSLGSWRFNLGFDWSFGDDSFKSKSSSQKVRELYFTDLDFAYNHNWSATDTHGITKDYAIGNNRLSSGNKTTRANGGWFDYNPYP